MSLLKASINIWNEDISSDADDRNMWSEFEHDLELLESDLDSCMLDEEGVEVVTVIADYIARQTNKNTQCDLCQEILNWNIGNLSSDDSLNKLSWGLTTPSIDLVNYVVAKSFAILDCAKSILLNSELPTRNLVNTKSPIICSKLTVETLGTRCEICSKLTIKAPEQGQA